MGLVVLVPAAVVGSLSKRRYEHIHVRFFRAVHGPQDFWKGFPQPLR